MKKRTILFTLLAITIAGLLLPQRFSMPVHDAKRGDYNQASFWYYPWGRSGTHKGVDIFAEMGTEVRSSTSGIVLFAGEIEMGGNTVIVLGPKWRLHYYAHLQEIVTTIGWVSRNEKIGTVGDSGNAKGKPPHLHYSIVTLVPYLWRIDSAPQGWKKMLFINPIEYLNDATS